MVEDTSVRDRVPFSLKGTLQGHNNWVTSIVCPSNPESDIIISSSRDGSILIWKLTGNVGDTCCVPYRRLCGHSYIVQDLAVSDDGKYLVSGSWDRTIRLWDIDRAEVVRKLVGHDNDVLSVAITGDTRIILSGSRDGTIKVWNTEGVLASTLKAGDHDEAVSCVRNINKNGDDTMISAGHDCAVKVWSRTKSSYDLAYGMYGHRECINALVVSDDGSVCISGDKGGHLILWKMDEKGVESCDHEDFNMGSRITSLALTQRPRNLLACGTEHGIKIFSLDSRSVVDELNPEIAQRNSVPVCMSLCWSRDGTTLFAGYDDNTIRVWQMDAH